MSLRNRLNRLARYWPHRRTAPPAVQGRDESVSALRSQLADIMRQLARLFCDADPPLAQRCYSVARRLKSALPIGPALLAEVHALCDLFDPPDRRPRL
jgi:hypothetical protein